jgi:hypothetical protein
MAMTLCRDELVGVQVRFDVALRDVVRRFVPALMHAPREQIGRDFDRAWQQLHRPTLPAGHDAFPLNSNPMAITNNHHYSVTPNVKVFEVYWRTRKPYKRWPRRPLVRERLRRLWNRPFLVRTIPLPPPHLRKSLDPQI